MKGATSHDLNAEMAVTGALLRNAKRVLELTPIDPEEFYHPTCKLVVTACLELCAASKPVDPITVADHLAEKLTAAGGFSGLSDMDSAYLTAENVAHYVAIIRDHALRRRVVMAACEAINVADNEHDSGEDAYTELLKQANALKGPSTEAEAITLLEVVRTTLKRMDDLANGRAVVRGIQTGYKDLDQMTGGISRGAVTILAGRPSQGKSALARRMAWNAALAGHPAVVFSMEDTRDRYGDRTMADLSMVNLSKFSDPTKGAFTKGDLDACKWAYEQVKCIPLLVDDSAGLSSAQIQNRTRQRMRVHKTELVVIDYVQLMREKGSRDKREEVDRAAESMVKMARDEGLAVLLLSQLSRESEKRDDKRPMLSDLRESGTLEQVADAVFMVHQEWRYLNPEKHEKAYKACLNIGELLVRKNKHGRQGEIKLKWDADVATYRDLSLREKGLNSWDA